MLQDVEHQDQRIPIGGLKARIERANVYVPTPRSVLRDQAGITFDALERGAESLQFPEEQTVTASNVENGIPSLWRTEVFKRANEQSLACPPPPMLVVQVAVTLRVFRNHELPGASALAPLGRQSTAGGLSPRACTPTQILADDSEKQQLHARHECHDDDEHGKAFRCASPDEPHVNGVDCEQR